MANEKAEFAVKILKEYAEVTGNLPRGTTDISPLEEWLILRLFAVSGSLPDLQQVIEARIKHFNSNHHTHEGSQLQQALNTIRRLVPPIQFKIGGQ